MKGNEKPSRFRVIMEHMPPFCSGGVITDLFIVDLRVFHNFVAGAFAGEFFLKIGSYFIENVQVFSKLLNSAILSEKYKIYVQHSACGYGRQ